MGLFSRNQRDPDAVGNREWISDIQHLPDEEQLDDKRIIWLHPKHDFNVNSVLTVRPGEQAIFIDNGNAVDTFTSGRYVLNTENRPLTSWIRNIFSGGATTFHCDVYFVREAHTEEIVWGTANAIPLYDSDWGKLEVRGYGAFKISIDNPLMMLRKMIGSSLDFETQEGLNKYFQNELMQHISSNIGRWLKEEKRRTGGEYFELVNEFDTMAGIIKPILEPIVADYGLRLQSFSIQHLDVDTEDDEVKKKIQMAQANRRARITEAQGAAGEMAALQNSQVSQAWLAQQQMEVMKNMSQNESGGGMASAGMGMGMGIGAMGMMGGMMNGMMGTMQPVQPQQPMQPPQPAQPAPAAANADDPMAKLQKLKSMLDMGLISQQDFDAKKQEILSTL